MKDTLSLDKKAACLAISQRLHHIVDEGDIEGLVEYCRELSPEWNAAIIGVLQSFYLHDTESFEWIMFILCLNKGFEELVARFFICLYQMKARSLE